jgi:hypothetical protein
MMTNITSFLSKQLFIDKQVYQQQHRSENSCCLHRKFVADCGMISSLEAAVSMAASGVKTTPQPLWNGIFQLLTDPDSAARRPEVHAVLE